MCPIALNCCKFSPLSHITPVVQQGCKRKGPYSGHMRIKRLLFKQLWVVWSGHIYTTVGIEMWLPRCWWRTKQQRAQQWSRTKDCTYLFSGCIIIPDHTCQKQNDALKGLEISKETPWFPVFPFTKLFKWKHTYCRHQKMNMVFGFK